MKLTEAARILWNPMLDDGLSVEDMCEAFRMGAAALRKLDAVEKWLDNEVFGLPEDDYEKGWRAACKAIRHRIASKEDA